MSKNLKEAKKKLIKDTILEAAREIVEESGFEELSIRKLATKVGYSPGNIYQYFEGKDQIIMELVQAGYKNILNSLKTEADFSSVEAEIRHKFRKYIKIALKNKYYYKTVMLSQDEDILKLTSILASNSDKDNLAIEKLKSLIIKGQNLGEFKETEAETQAQIFWTATFGLIIRMIIENISDQKKQQKLIENHFNLIFAGLKKESA